MKKNDLIEALSRKSKISQSNVKFSVNTIIDEIFLAISSGEGVEIRGFGGFQKRHRKERIGINPKTGQKTSVKEKYVPFFRPGKLLKDSVNKD